METLITMHALVEYDGKYLIMQRANHRSNPGYWNCVTGHVKEDENVETTALREVKEETNLDGEILKTAEPLVHQTRNQRWIVFAYLIQVSDISGLKIDENESQAYRWIEKDDEIVRKYEGLKETLRVLEII